MKSTIFSIIIAVTLIGGSIFLLKNNPQTTNDAPVNNVRVVDGKQIINIHVKGGYQPTKSVAKIGIPTVLRFETGGTFDCSASIRIPSMNIGKILPPSGTTDIDLGTPEITTLQGTCGMGMYPFEVDFQN